MLDTAPFSPSVHAPETEPHPPKDAPGADFCVDVTPAERFRHSGWQRTRNLVRGALFRTNQSTSRILNWDNCGDQAYVLENANRPGEYKIAGSNCHDRFCVPCSRLRSQCICNSLNDAIGSCVVRFITLTLKHRVEPLSQTLDRLYESFSKLRRHKLWKKLVDGGAAFVEVKWSERSQEWHPHLHILVVGRFLPHDRLRAAWYAVTGDSLIVDIRLARNKGDVTHYVTKYVTKVLSSSFVNRPALLDESMTAMRGRKLCLTFGSWRGILLTKDDDGCEWVNVGSLNDWFTRAISGDQEAAILCHDLAPDLLRDEVAREAARAPPPELKLRVANTSQKRFSFREAFQS